MVTFSYSIGSPLTRNQFHFTSAYWMPPVVRVYIIWQYNPNSPKLCSSVINLRIVFAFHNLSKEEIICTNIIAPLIWHRVVLQDWYMFFIYFKMYYATPENKVSKGARTKKITGNHISYKNLLWKSHTVKIILNNPLNQRSENSST